MLDTVGATAHPFTTINSFFNAERLRNPRSPSGAEGWRGWMRDLAVQWNGMSEAEKQVRAYPSFPAQSSAYFRVLQPYRDQYVEERKAYLAAKA